MKFTIEKVANLIMITTDCGVIFKVWNEEEFTERKLNNAIKRISNNYNGETTFVKTF